MKKQLAQAQLKSGEKIIQIVKGDIFSGGVVSVPNEDDTIDCREYLLLTNMGRLIAMEIIDDERGIFSQYWKIDLPEEEKEDGTRNGEISGSKHLFKVVEVVTGSGKEGCVKFDYNGIALSVDGEEVYRVGSDECDMHSFAKMAEKLKEY